MKTPEYPEGREIVLIANDVTVQNGSFGVREDEFFERASEYARRRGLPRVYIACARELALLCLAEEIHPQMLRMFILMQVFVMLGVQQFRTPIFKRMQARVKFLFKKVHTPWGMGERHGDWGKGSVDPPPPGGFGVNSATGHARRRQGPQNGRFQEKNLVRTQNQPPLALPAMDRHPIEVDKKKLTGTLAH